MLNKAALLGCKIGSGSGGRPGQVGPLIETPGGRILYRHSSGMGTVLEFNDGQPRRVLVLDAKYRANKRFGAFKNSGLLASYAYSPKWYLNPLNIATTTAQAANVTDDWINANSVRDKNTAKENCDLWLNYIHSVTNIGTSYSFVGVPAVEYCRSLSVTGTLCDLPIAFP